MQEHAISGFDGTPIMVYYHPPKKGRPLLFYVHGGGSHAGSGKHLQARAIRQGFGFASLDLRGHGRSGGLRSYVKDFDHFVEDVHSALLHIQTQCNANIVFVANSMGSIVCTKYFLLHDNPKVIAMVMVSPATKLRLDTPKIYIWAGWILKSLPFLNKIRYPMGISPETATHDTKEQEWILHDTLGNNFITAPMYFNLLDAMKWFREHPQKYSVPVMIQTAGSDQTIDMDVTMDFIVHLEQKNTIHHKHYPECYHSLLLEKRREKILDHMFSWIKSL